MAKKSGSPNLAASQIGPMLPHSLHNGRNGPEHTTHIVQYQPWSHLKAETLWGWTISVFQCVSTFTYSLQLYCFSSKLCLSLLTTFSFPYFRWWWWCNLIHPANIEYHIQQQQPRT